MRISDLRSDLCASDLLHSASLPALAFSFLPHVIRAFQKRHPGVSIHLDTHSSSTVRQLVANQQFDIGLATRAHEVAGMSASTFLRSVGACILPPGHRSEEHTSELQSLMRISYAVFCLK